MPCDRLGKGGSAARSAYYTDENFSSFFAITYAGNDWYFFMDTDQCGAQYAIKEAGDHIIRLK